MQDHSRFAAAYDRLLAPVEQAGLAERRRRLLSQARGRVLEVGAGTGLNLAHYRAGEVSSVVALEPDRAMRRQLVARVDRRGAVRSARSGGPLGPVPVEVSDAGIEEVRYEDGSFDTIVCTLVLCTVPDLPAAARRCHELLTPGGRLLFIEHARWPGVRGRLQHLVTPAWRRLVPGCHLDRNPLVALRDAGLSVTDCDKFTMSTRGVGRSAVSGQSLLGLGVQGTARRWEAA